MKNLMMLMLCVIFAASAWATAATNSQTFKIKGVITEPAAKAKVYLLYQTQGRKIIDSSLVLNNTFSFKGIVPEPLFATLLLDHDGKDLAHEMNKLVDEADLIHFYLHKGQINIRLTDSIANAVFTHSNMNVDYANLRTLKNIQAEHLLAKLSAKMQRDKDTASAVRYVAYYDSLKAARRPVLREFANRHPYSYIALVALKEYAGAFPDEHEIAPMFNRLSQDVKNSAAGKDFAVLLKSSRYLSIGKPAPDFNQPDTAGKPVSLSSFKGRYVLIDFWASWCGPCRDDNPKWVSVYEHLKNKNFTILGISLDSYDTRKTWLDAIKKDNLNWTQLSDLKHWDNAVAKRYGINAIPQNVLIDPDGMIAAKNIEPKELLELMRKSRYYDQSDSH